MTKNNFLDRLIERIDAIDSTSIQACILHLAREKGFLETVFNAIHEGILVIDHFLKIRYYNRAAKDLLGLPDDISRLRISQFLRNVDWRRILRQDVEEWSRMSRQEIEILYPNRRIVQFYLVPHEDVQGEGLAIVILRDVTESRELVLDELESEKMQAVSMLAAGVAHEIGNPLNSLYLHLQLLQRQFSGGRIHKKEAAELVNVAKNEIERLDRIINYFLRFLRPSRPNMIETDVKEVIVETLTFMRAEIETRTIDVKCTWPDCLPKISGDPEQLKQAFYNIVKNAIQAMPEGGRIDIVCSYDDDYVELEFSDTGVGIGAAELGKVFEPFTTSKKDGNGLGMMIIDRILREHGARHILETRKGKGTTFIIRFPRESRRMRVLPQPKDDDYPADQERY